MNAKNTLKQLLQQNFRVLLVSPPALGKTSIFASACEGWADFISIPLHHTERVDWSGGMVPDHQRGVMRQLPLELLHNLSTRPVDAKPLVLLIDDLGKAPVDVQGALKSVITRARKVLPSNIIIAGATNRPSDRAGVFALDESLRSEFDMAFNMPTPDSGNNPEMEEICTWSELVQEWCDWLIDTYPQCYELAAWHRSPQLGAVHPVGPVLYGWRADAHPAARFPDFRSWEVIARHIQAGTDSLANLSATIGRGQASAFFAFRQISTNLPDPQQVWMDPAGSPVPSEPSALCLTSTRLASALQPQFVQAFCTYIDRMPQVFGALAGRDAFRRLGSKLSGAKAWQQWFLAHQDLFTA